MLLGRSVGLCEIEICGGRMGTNVRKGGRATLPPFRSPANVARGGRGDYVKLKYVAAEWARLSAKWENRPAPVAFDRGRFS